jgi:hypothetical protein
MGGVDRAVSLKALCHDQPPQPPRMSLLDRRLLYVAMTRAKRRSALAWCRSAFLSMDGLQKAIALCMRRVRALSWKRCCLTLKRSPGQSSQRLGFLRPVRQLKWTSRRVWSVCGAKSPCRRHALLFAYAMLRNVDVCSSFDRVAKLRLRRIADRDSVGFRRAFAGAMHVGAAGERSRPVLLCLDLDKVVPPDHLVRQIDGLLDLSWVHKELAPFYSHTGRPSIESSVKKPV